MKQKILLLITLCFSSYMVNAQYKDVFDRVIRSKFEIQTNRKLDIDEVNPYNITKVVQEGSFLFLIGNNDGVWMNYPDKLEYMDAPDDPRFEQCLRSVARIFQKDVIFSYTIPIIVQHAKYRSGTAWCWTGRFKGVEKGNTSTWAGVDINWNIYNSGIHYVLEEGEIYSGLYLTEIIAHEIFHSFFDNVIWNHKVYPYLWTSDNIEEYEDGRFRPCADELGLVSFFYNGKNAMKANGGQLIQGYGNHYSNAFQETDDKFFTVSYRISKAVNHLGAISLGVMKDNGFVLKDGVSFERKEFTGYIFNEDGQAYGWVSMGDTIYFNPKDVQYGFGPTRDNYPLKNENIALKESFSLFASVGILYFENYDSTDTVMICDIFGHIIINQKLPVGTNAIPINSTGIYIVKKGSCVKKIFCP